MNEEYDELLEDSPEMNKAVEELGKRAEKEIEKGLKEVAKEAEKAIAKAVKAGLEKLGQAIIAALGPYAPLIIAGIVILLLIIMAAVVILGPTVGYFDDLVTDTERSMEYFGVSSKEALHGIRNNKGQPLFDENGYAIYFRDAGEFLYVLDTYPDLFMDDELSYYLDRNTIRKILQIVDSYNEELKITKKIKYEYIEETGSFKKNYDDVTGEPTGTEVNTITKRVRRSRYDEETKKRIYYYVDEEIPAASKNKDAEIELSRNFVNGNSSVGASEQIGYLRWQPILAMCETYIQANFEREGSYGFGLGDGAYYMSDGELEQIVDMYRYNTVYLAEDIFECNTKLEPDFYKKSGYGYKLTVTDTAIGTKNQKRVTVRTPMIAPYYVANSFCSYEYNYKQVFDHPGYYELYALTMTYNPVSFFDRVNEVFPYDTEFELESYLDILESLPYADDLYQFYDDLAQKAQEGRSYVEVETNVRNCSLIGTYINMSNRLLPVITDPIYIDPLHPLPEFGAPTPGNGDPSVPFNPIPEAEKKKILDAIPEGTRKRVVAFALDKVGHPYSQELRDDGYHYDCSSLVYYAWKSVGVNIAYRGEDLEYDGWHKRNSTCAAAICLGFEENEMTRASFADLKPGDLIFSSSKSNGRYKNITHVMMYVGQGMMVEARGKKYGVVYRKAYKTGVVSLCTPLDD